MGGIYGLTAADAFHDLHDPLVIAAADRPIPVVNHRPDRRGSHAPGHTTDHQSLPQPEFNKFRFLKAGTRAGR